MSTPYIPPGLREEYYAILAKNLGTSNNTYQGSGTVAHGGPYNGTYYGGNYPKGRFVSSTYGRYR